MELGFSFAWQRIGHSRRGYKPEFKLERYPPLAGAITKCLLQLLQSVCPFIVVRLYLSVEFSTPIWSLY